MKKKSKSDDLFKVNDMNENVKICSSMQQNIGGNDRPCIIHTHTALNAVLVPNVVITV